MPPFVKRGKGDLTLSAVRRTIRSFLRQLSCRDTTIQLKNRRKDQMIAFGDRQRINPPPRKLRHPLLTKGGFSLPPACPLLFKRGSGGFNLISRPQDNLIFLPTLELSRYNDKAQKQGKGSNDRLRRQAEDKSPASLRFGTPFDKRGLFAAAGLSWDCCKKDKYS